MAASDKLRALKGRTYRTVSIPDTEQSVVTHEDALWEALPQLLAVVEAAENYVGVLERSGYEPTMAAALTALEEALS